MFDQQTKVKMIIKSNIKALLKNQWTFGLELIHSHVLVSGIINVLSLSTEPEYWVWVTVWVFTNLESSVSWNI